MSASLVGSEMCIRDRGTRGRGRPREDEVAAAVPRSATVWTNRRGTSGTSSLRPRFAAWWTT
eukprot:13581391-Alexandrium_andersonii.AAC.1